MHWYRDQHHRRIGIRNNWAGKRAISILLPILSLDDAFDTKIYRVKFNAERFYTRRSTATSVDLIRHEAQQAHLVSYCPRNLTPLPHRVDAMPINKVQFQPGMSMSEFVERYSSEDHCVRYVFTG